MLHRRRLLVPAALALLAACDRPPTAPPTAPARAQTAQGAVPVIAPQDLGVLPGDDRSEATYITEDGVVYGNSYPPGSNTPRFFRWTSGSGVMTQVSAIPRPPSPPLPTLPAPSPYVRTVPTAANAKGEATGVLCWTGCFTSFYDPTDQGGHVFRYSAGAGVRELDSRRQEPASANIPEASSHGWSINRWGHVAGLWWAFDDSELQLFLWTPVDSFHLIGPFLIENDNGDTQVNDLDQVLSHSDNNAFVWRPDLGTRELGGLCCAGELAPRGRAQQANGTLVVGEAPVPVTGGAQMHAALWRVPAVNRSAFPKVNANLYTATSTLSLASSGGRYYQTYRATQATAAGPYLELVDWGDGATSRRTRSSVGGTWSQAHTYTKKGTFWVRVYVEDAQGRWGVSEHKVVITA